MKEGIQFYQPFRFGFSNILDKSKNEQLFLALFIYLLRGWSIKSVWNSPGGVQKYQNHDYVSYWRKDLCGWYDEEVIDD